MFTYGGHSGYCCRPSVSGVDKASSCEELDLPCWQRIRIYIGGHAHASYQALECRYFALHLQDLAIYAIKIGQTTFEEGSIKMRSKYTCLQ
jgi:hypothetical protein